jgi:serine/threonine protein kinase
MPQTLVLDGQDLHEIEFKLTMGKTRMKIEDYELLGILGQGSYGKVYCAQEKGTKKKYAIKVLDKYHIMKVKLQCA